MSTPRSREKVKRSPHFEDSVFINCPFDKDYWPIFEAIVFCVVDCGFIPRSSLEFVDSGKVRLEKLRDLIRSSKYALHDLSRVELAPANGLPRFNMPFEFGLDLGARFFGSPTLRQKCCLVLDAVEYNYQKTLSDIAGQDPRYHHNSLDEAISAVRTWLRAASARTNVPGDMSIKRRFEEFSKDVPRIAANAGLDRQNLSYPDYVHMVEVWLSAHSA